MSLKIWVYQKNIPNSLGDHMLVIKYGDKITDVYSIDTAKEVSRRHATGMSNAVVRKFMPLLVGAYKEIEINNLNGYLLTATAQALGNLVLS